MEFSSGLADQQVSLGDRTATDMAAVFRAGSASTLLKANTTCLDHLTAGVLVDCLLEAVSVDHLTAGVSAARNLVAVPSTRSSRAAFPDHCSIQNQTPKTCKSTKLKNQQNEKRRISSRHASSQKFDAAQPVIRHVEPSNEI